MLSKPSVAKYKFTIRDEDFDANNLKVVATSAHELIAVLVTGPAAFRIFDASDTSKLIELESILIAANAGESDPYTPAQLIPMSKGIIVKIEQGKGNNAEIHLLFN